MKKIYLLLISFIISVNIMAQTNDVGIVRIIEPALIVCPNTSITVKVRIKNFGTQTQTSIPITYYRTGQYIYFTEIWNGTLIAGDSIDYTFLNLMNIPIGTSTAMCAYTELMNDSYLHNDTVCKSLAIWTVVSYNIKSGQANVNIGYTGYYSTSPGINTNVYFWSYIPSNGVTINAFDTTAIVSFGAGASSGVLTVYGYDSVSHCSGNPASLNITIGTGIDEINNNSFLLSQNAPNPASAKTNIEYMLSTSGNIKFELITLLGEKVIIKTVKAETGKNNFTMDVSALPNGIYYYSMEYKGKKQFKKLVVSK